MSVRASGGERGARGWQGEGKVERTRSFELMLVLVIQETFCVDLSL